MFSESHCVITPTTIHNCRRQSCNFHKTGRWQVNPVFVLVCSVRSRCLLNDIGIGIFSIDVPAVLWCMCAVPTKDYLKTLLWYKLDKALLLLKCSCTKLWMNIITQVTKKPNLANAYIFWLHCPTTAVGGPGTSPLHNSKFYSGVVMVTCGYCSQSWQTS